MESEPVANDRGPNDPRVATASSAAPSTKPREALNSLNDDAMLDRTIATLRRLRLEREAAAAAHADDPSHLATSGRPPGSAGEAATV
jgi:hypothetical protein